MNEAHDLIWISPILPHSELEQLYRWVNQHLEESGLQPLASFNRIRTSMLFEPSEALRLAFAIEDRPEDSRNSPHAISRLKESLWSEIFAGSQPLAPPLALSLRPRRLDAIRKKLICFDMDSTLINEEVIDEIARQAGVYDEISAITEQAMQGKLDFTQSLKARVSLFRGLPKDQAGAIVSSLHVSPGGEVLLQHLRSQGLKTAVVSGGFDFILRHFQKQLFLDHAYGNTLVLDEDDRFTGAVEDPVVDARYKQKLVAQLKTNYGFSTDETVTVGDGANDVLMMDEAGISVSFCGKPRLSAHTNTLILDRNLMWIKPLT
ncbi:MAG: phosphoserine phosphatase SerB [Proteobacteria bacterium]|nr:phosphoserine phosphatase SerB [Pseudomonadota bacterium]